jgi:F0F1-type ATP synthase alpha subunit
MVSFCVGNKQITGLVLNLESTKVSAVVLGDDFEIKPVNTLFVNLI